jgi:hypothetical protein
MVMLVYSQTSVTLLNGVMTFSDTRKANMSRDALFRVQHLDIGTAVPVDLSHVRLYLWSLTICAQNSPQSTPGKSGLYETDDVESLEKFVGF